MFLLISDANVLIDFESANLTSLIFHTSFLYKIAVLDVLFDSELKKQHSHLLQIGLIIKSLTAEFVQQAEAFSTKYRRTSNIDRLALSLALQEKCALLTGDKDLKNAAKQEKVNVHGTLWVMDQLFKSRLINPQHAEHSFTLMKNSGRRLPWPRADKLVLEHSLVEARDR